MTENKSCENCGRDCPFPVDNACNKWIDVNKKSCDPRSESYHAAPERFVGADKTTEPVAGASEPQHIADTGKMVCPICGSDMRELSRSLTAGDRGFICEGCDLVADGKRLSRWQKLSVEKEAAAEKRGAERERKRYSNLIGALRLWLDASLTTSRNEFIVKVQQARELTHSVLNNYEANK